MLTPTRIEFNVITGVSTVLNLTPTEIATAQAATAAEAAAQALLINPVGFAQAIKAALGGIEVVATLPPSIQPIFQWFYLALQAQNYADMQTLLVTNRAALDAVNTAIYTDVKAAAATYNIPMVLP